LLNEFEALTDILQRATQRSLDSSSSSSSLSDASSTVSRLSLIEVGCGCGNALFPLVSLLPDVDFFACDCSKNAIALVQQRRDALIETEKSRLNCFVHDIVSESFPSSLISRMDFATLVFVLSALKPLDHANVLLKVAQLLKPGGRLFIRDYATLDFAQVRFASASLISPSFYLRADGTCSYFFELDALSSLVKQSGLEIESSQIIEKLVQNRKVGLSMRRRFVQIVASK